MTAVSLLLADILRAGALFAAATTYVLAVANLVVSFAVLSKKPFSLRAFLGSGAGFLFSHIVFVVVPFQGFVTWGVFEVATRTAAEDLTFRAPLLFVLCGTMTLGYAIIFRVELARLRMKDAIQP